MLPLGPDVLEPEGGRGQKPGRLCQLAGHHGSARDLRRPSQAKSTPAEACRMKHTTMQIQPWGLQCSETSSLSGRVWRSLNLGDTVSISL